MPIVLFEEYQNVFLVLLPHAKSEKVSLLSRTSCSRLKAIYHGLLLIINRDAMLVMRSTLLISLLGMLLTACAPAHDEGSVANVKKFYHYYITEMDRTIPQIKFNEDTLQKYCTASFLKKWKDNHEYDMVLQAQDYYIEWANNNIITPLSNKENNEYNVCLIGPLKHCIIVTVKKEKGKYKISDTRATD